MVKKIGEAIKVILNEVKSDPIMMKDKEEPGANSEGTETKQKQPQKDMQANSEHDVKQTDTLSW